MANTALLEEYIQKSGKKKGYLAGVLNISGPYFTKLKATPEKFKFGQVDLICKECNIPKKDRDVIFLP